MSELSQAQSLATGWISHFASADRSIRWGNIEKEHSLWLDDRTLLVGRIDADGLTEDGDFFFADWKSLGPRRRIAEVKAEYRLDPQMLTYGLLTSFTGGARFLVRWAQKKEPPVYHYEWYSYTPQEIDWWRSQVLEIAAKIHADKARGMKPFITGLGSCLRYGQAYACPFLEPACSKQQWDAKPEGWEPRGSHLQIERDLIAGHELMTDVRLDKCELILDATRIDTWLGCNERYRREYQDNVKPPAGEALAVGIELHEILHQYYNKLKESQDGRTR